jgi:hypothetical protein
MPCKAGNQRQYFEFALWAGSLGRPVSIKDIEGYFDIGHQSAWKTHRNWMKALQHHRENTKPGGNRHPQTTVQGP